DEFCIGSLTAACTGTGELKQRLFELAALDSVRSHRVLRLYRHRVIPVLCLVHLGLERLHHKCLFFCRAYIRAASAALAVEYRYLDPEIEPVESLADGLLRFEALGSVLHFFLIEEERPYCGVRAHI